MLDLGNPKMPGLRARDQGAQLFPLVQVPIPGPLRLRVATMNDVEYTNEQRAEDEELDALADDLDTHADREADRLDLWRREY